MLNERAYEKMMNRKTTTSTYYLDLKLVGDYWGWFDKRFYHHTAQVRAARLSLSAVILNVEGWSGPCPELHSAVQPV